MTEVNSISDLTRAVLSIYGRETVIKLISQLRKMDKVASGKLLNSLDWKLKQFVESFQLEFGGEPHGIYVLQGRKPGKFVPLKPLQEWMKLRGINLKYTYPINRKIYKFGIKPANFLDEVISDNSINDLVGDLEQRYEKEIESQIELFFYKN